MNIAATIVRVSIAVIKYHDWFVKNSCVTCIVQIWKQKQILLKSEQHFKVRLGQNQKCIHFKLCSKRKPTKTKSKINCFEKETLVRDSSYSTLQQKITKGRWNTGTWARHHGWLTLRISELKRLRKEDCQKSTTTWPKISSRLPWATGIFWFNYNKQYLIIKAILFRLSVTKTRK